jgi:hypothetical protein
MGEGSKQRRKGERAREIPSRPKLRTRHVQVLKKTTKKPEDAVGTEHGRGAAQSPAFPSNETIPFLASLPPSLPHSKLAPSIWSSPNCFFFSFPRVCLLLASIIRRHLNYRSGMRFGFEPVWTCGPKILMQYYWTSSSHTHEQIDRKEAPSSDRP